MSCHPCLPLSWVNAVSPGIVAALMASWTHLMPAGGGVSSPRTFARAASSPWTRFALPPGHVLSTLSVRTPPPEGRVLRSVQSRHASQVCAPLCGWRFKPACPSRRGVPRARSASFSPPVSSLLGTGPAAVRGDGRTPAPAPGAGIARKSFNPKPCALICGRKAKNSTAFVALFRD